MSSKKTRYYYDETVTKGHYVIRDRDDSGEVVVSAKYRWMIELILPVLNIGEMV